MKIQLTNNFDRRLQVPTDISDMIKDTEGKTALPMNRSSPSCTLNSNHVEPFSSLFMIPFSLISLCVFYMACSLYTCIFLTM